MDGVKISPEDERAVSIALGGMRAKGLLQGAIDADDVRQEMLVALWHKPNDEMARKVTQARSAGIDYVRKILGRNGGKNRTDYTDEVPDVAGGDDPAQWVEVAQQVEQATRKYATRTRKARPPVGAPDPRSLTRIAGGPPAPMKPPVSAWQKVYESMESGGDGIVLTEEQARAFCSWGRAHKCRLSRRRLPGGEYGVWRCQS